MRRCPAPRAGARRSSGSRREGSRLITLHMGNGCSARPNAAAIGRAARITRDGSRLAAWAIPTDEELLIARDTVRLVQGMETRY